MLYLLYTVHVAISIFLILVVLLQQGKGADLSVFGGGGSQAAFGARGAATVLHKLTVICFVLFIVTTLSIGILKSRSSPSVMGGLATETSESSVDEPTAPAGGELPAEGGVEGGLESDAPDSSGAETGTPDPTAESSTEAANPPADASSEGSSL